MGIGVPFEHLLCSITGALDHKFAPKWQFCYPQKGIFYKIWSNFSPKGQEFYQKIAKNSNASLTVCLYTHFPPPLPPVPPLSERWYLYKKCNNFTNNFPVLHTFLWVFEKAASNIWFVPLFCDLAVNSGFNTVSKRGLFPNQKNDDCINENIKGLWHMQIIQCHLSTWYISHSNTCMSKC